MKISERDVKNAKSESERRMRKEEKKEMREKRNKVIKHLTEGDIMSAVEIAYKDAYVYDGETPNPIQIPEKYLRQYVKDILKKGGENRCRYTEAETALEICKVVKFNSSTVNKLEKLKNIANESDKIDAKYEAMFGGH